MVKGERAEFPPLPVMHKLLDCLTPCFGNRCANAVVKSTKVTLLGPKHPTE